MLLTIRDLSQQLQIKPATLYAWAAAGKIPCLKIHGVLRFDPKAVQNWLSSFTIHPDPLPLQLGLQEQGDSVDELIARAKRALYTARRGNQTNSEPSRKGG
ncbi:MAG: helix-turn-helix domain-containing protein [Nitrospiraceae bacterium]